MRAACYERVGPASDVLQLVELPTPVPGAGDVRVRLQCSGVNPSDVKTRAGARSRELPFPRIIPHSDGAGVVDAVGDGVTQFTPGDRVWVWNAAWGRPDGTAAEYVVLPAEQIVPLPDHTGPEVGACLGIPGLTAWHAVHCHGGVRGQTVLIPGGAGAVAHYAIQMARDAGAARVLSTASSETKAEIARQAGADAVFNYREEDVAARVMDATGGAGAERIIELEFAANAATDLAAVRANGLIVAFGANASEVQIPFFPAILKNVLVQFFIIYNLPPEDRARAIAGVTDLLERDVLHHRIAERLPLAEIATAHERVESGAAVGNVVIDLE